MSKRKVILIGGAPLSGKSTLAAELAKKLAVTWVSTDDIRKWMRELVRKEDYPHLFENHGLSAEAFYREYQTAPEVFEHVKRENRDVQKGVGAMINNFWWWSEFIIEGIAITPMFVQKFQDSHADIKVVPVFLIDKDKENVRKRLNTRGLWGDAGTYPDYIKPIELEWTMLLNDYYEQEAAKYDFPTHDVSELRTLEDLLSPKGI